MSRGLTSVIGREACGDTVRVMIIGGFAQSLDHRCGCTIGYILVHYISRCEAIAAKKAERTQSVGPCNNLREGPAREVSARRGAGTAGGARRRDRGRHRGRHRRGAATV